MVPSTQVSSWEESATLDTDSSSSRNSYAVKDIINLALQSTTVLHGSNSISHGGVCPMKSGLSITDSGLITW